MKNVELPKDALGREIPLDIKVLYDEYGEKFFIDKVTYMRMTGSWWFSGHFGLQSVEHRYRASRLHITLPDSWKELLKDLDEYARGAGPYVGCYGEHIAENVADRIRKLRGEADAD